MGLHWYSPLEVDSSEIARYSAQVLPALAETGELAAVSNGESAGRSLPAWARELSLPPAATSGDQLPVYHIGNHAQHVPIVERALREPGIVVLHDLNLVDLARSYGVARGQPGWWRQMLRLQYGDRCEPLLRESRYSPEAEQALIAGFPLFLPFIANALGVVVHSRIAEDSLEGQYPGRFRLRRMSLPYLAPGRLPARDYSERPLRVLFCGHPGPNRRLEQFIAAWGRMPEPGSLSLELFGNLGNTAMLRAAALEAGVDDWLTFRGFVADAELDEALARAHFALNLRWPSMGEASASQLRYWSAGLPTLVTATGWYDELPAEVVCKIDPEQESAELDRCLAHMVGSATGYAAMGEAGHRRLRSEHAISAYVSGLTRFAGELRDGRLATQYLEHRLVGAIADLCPDTRCAALFERPLRAATDLLRVPEEIT
ncbi:hypothetical protein [Parahaliea mediterranea]|uniref:Glycosyltransferase n=1 Tax=Parahaliea mediterranea TaxID=651086 RepID=A0A939DBM9_9GAMM|nr:hypothetical protein [Parahaliea mediterranea]MBN7795186.1 hypothetical protein [Parahaliea mediterranea]